MKQLGEITIRLCYYNCRDLPFIWLVAKQPGKITIRHCYYNFVVYLYKY